MRYWKIDHCVRAKMSQTGATGLHKSKRYIIYILQNGWKTLCSPEHFTPQHALLPGTLCPSTQFAAWNTLLLGTLCSLEHFASQHTLLPGTLCSLNHLEHFTFLQIFLLHILCSLEYLKQSVPGSKVCQGEKCSWEQSVLRSKVR